MARLMTISVTCSIQKLQNLNIQNRIEKALHYSTLGSYMYSEEGANGDKIIDKK